MVVSVAYVLACELGHFMLAFFAGLMAWLLMTTIYNRLYLNVDARNETAPGPITRLVMSHSGLFIFLLAICVALLSHVLEDYYFSIV